MSDLLVAYDPAKPIGQRLAPEVVAEIEEVAPSTVNNGSITEPKMANESVDTRAIVPGAVESEQIAAGGVLTENLGSQVVTGPNIAPGAVDPTKVTDGIFICKDASGNDIAMTGVFGMTAAAYAALAAPDPNTTYFVV